MPFINITFTDAKLSLNDTSIISDLLKKQKINPKEADLLRKIHDYSQNRTKDNIQKLEDLCIQYFPSNSGEALQKIKQFIDSNNKRVPWVIFSRTFQFIEYDSRNPLDDYSPRVSEVLTLKSSFKAIR